jgi:hypothetical protein
VFCITCLAFFCYDRFVRIRQMKVIDTAERSNAIVASLFPADVRKRLMNGSGKSKTTKNKNTFLNTPEGPKFKLKSYLTNDTGVAGPGSKPGNEAVEDTPIADLFPNTTVMFADICGFTACAYIVFETLCFVHWILGL